MNRTGAAVRLLLGTAIRVDPRRAVVVLTLAPLLGAVSVAQGLSLEWMVDGAVRGHPSLVAGGVVLLVGVTVAIHQIGAVAADLRVVLQQRVGLEFDRRLMASCAGRFHLDHYQDPAFLDTAELLRQRRGELGNAFAAVVENVNVFARFAAAAVLLAGASPVLALLPLCALPLALATRRQERLIAEAEQATAEVDRQRKALFSLAGDPAAARELRLYRLEGEIAGRHRDAFAAVNREQNAARTRGAVAVAASWAAFVGALVGGIIIVVLSVLAGTASPGEAVLVVVLGTRLISATAGLASLIAWLRRSLDTVGLFLRLVDHLPERSQRPRPRRPDLPPRGDLVFENVSFTYPGRSTPALAHLDLRLSAGSTVAVVGENGAGKSTIVALLAGLYPPSEGRISYAGHDLTELDPHWWRSRVTACFQDFCRFELLVRETVGLGDTAALEDRAAVESALDRAGATDVVAALPAGLDTQLGRTFPGGTDLSAGQWQKIALARARMRTAPTLILLDEPAAGLDPDTEAALLDRYLAAPRADGSITVIVSHRFTTVRAADLIAVLDGGRVVEFGSHAELIERGGRYADMYALHAAAYSPAYR